MAVLLAPMFLQGIDSCKTGDTRLAQLAVIINGVDRIAFDPDVRSYDVWLPVSADSALVRAVPADPGAQVWINVYAPSTAFGVMTAQVGGGQVTAALEPGLNTLKVYVKAPGGASDYYDVDVDFGPCVPETCVSLGNECGQHHDGCDGLTADCGTCAVGDICSGGTCVAPGVKEFRASQTTCESPCPVFFETVSIEGDSWATITGSEYLWDFDDPGSTRPTARGYLAAHVFELPIDASSGQTFDVSVTQDGVAWAVKTITVNPPSGTTRCVSPTSNYTGCPAGATHYTNLDTALGAAGPGDQVLAHRGESYGTLTFSPDGSPGPVYWGAYGTGTKPFWSRSTWMVLGTKWKIADQDIDARGIDDQFWFMAGENHVLLMRNHILGAGFTNSQGTFGAGNHTPGYLGGSWYFIVDNHDEDAQGTNYMAGTGIAWIGNHVERHTNTGDHSLRVGGAEYVLVAENLHASTQTHTSLTLRGAWQAGQDTLRHWTKWALVRDNKFGLLVSFQPKNVSSEEWVQYVIHERNVHDFSLTGLPAAPSAYNINGVKTINGIDIVFRNNVFNGFLRPFIISEQTLGLPTQRVQIYNNSAYDLQDSSHYLAGITGTTHTIRNNVMYAENGQINCISAGAGTISNNWCYNPDDDSDCLLPDGTEGPLACDNPTTESPRFLNTTNPDNANYFQLASGTVGVDGGHTVPIVWEDFKNIARSQGGAFDVGARER